MGAIALLLSRDERPPERSAFESVLSALAHRGVHGSESFLRGSAAFGRLRFATTPEEVGEAQPLSDPVRGVDLCFDGRLDNRADLLAALGDGADASRLSDAGLALRAYAAWGERSFDRFLGPFAAVVLDSRRRCVVAARDALGDRPLCYVVTDRLLAVATEEQALLTLPWVSRRLNETTVARFFAFEGPVPGETFYSDVRELPPAHVMVVSQGGIAFRRTWAPDPEPGIRHRRDEDYADHFRAVFEEAVRCRLRSVTPPAVLMSGGLDSAPVAAVAARELARQGRRLTTVSYVFDELPSCDERRYMDPMVRRFGLDARRFAGDDAWPFSNLASWTFDPSSPMEGLYRKLRSRSYAAAREAGATVLLTGEHGDALYCGGEQWLADLLREGRYGQALAELAAHALLHGVLRRPARYGLRSALGALARAKGWWGPPPPLPGASPPSWLTPSAASRVAASAPFASPAVGTRRPWQHSWVLDPATARGIAVEQVHAARAGMEIRFPFRDRRVVELFLGLPAHQLSRPGESKRIMRRAMQGLLPDEIRRRRRPTSLEALFDRGLSEGGLSALESILGSANALWPRFVDARWMTRAIPRLRAGATGPEAVLPWQCAVFELWHARACGASPPV